MRWKVTIEGMDEFGGRDTAEMVIEKEFSRLAKGEIGLTLSDGKTIMACLQQLVVKQQCEAYVLTSRYCTDFPADQGLRQAQDPNGLWTCGSQQSAYYELSALPSPFLCRFGRPTRHLP